MCDSVSKRILIICTWTSKQTHQLVRADQSTNGSYFIPSWPLRISREYQTWNLYRTKKTTRDPCMARRLSKLQDLGSSPATQSTDVWLDGITLIEWLWRQNLGKLGFRWYATVVLPVLACRPLSLSSGLRVNDSRWSRHLNCSLGNR